MKKLIIDLATTVLDQRMQVHLVRPGARYAFHEAVGAQGVLPVDAPFLQFEHGKELPPAKKIASQLERSRVLRDWAKQPQSSRPRRPSIALGDYTLDLVDPDRSAIRTRIRNASNQILYKIPGGTLIVVPSRSLAGEAILGRITSRTDIVEVTGEGSNKGLKFPARRLVDIRRVSMLELPAPVIKASRTVKVVELLSGHEEDRVLRMYFGDYQRSDDHVAGVLAHTKDFDARVVARMIELHMAIDHSLKTRQAMKPGTALYNPAVVDAPQFHARVDSPDGRAFLESATAITFVVKLLLIVASSGLPATAAAQAIENDCLVVENSRSSGSQDTIRASRDALVDFASVSGHTCIADYIVALQDGLERNKASIAGRAKMEE